MQGGTEVRGSARPRSGLAAALAAALLSVLVLAPPAPGARAHSQPSSGAPLQSAAARREGCPPAGGPRLASCPPARHGRSGAFATSELQTDAAGDGSISGHVTAALGAAALEGIEVCAAPAAERPGRLAPENCSITAADGGYEVTELAPGQWNVSFKVSRLEPADNFAPQSYKGHELASEADPVTVTGGATTTGIDAAMEPGAQISGTVTAAGVPVEGVHVCPYSIDDLQFDAEAFDTCTQSGANGRYTINSLPTGSYAVAFAPAAPYAPMFFGGKALFTEAEEVTATAGSNTTGVDAALEHGGAITGRVVDAKTGNPVEKATVCPSLQGSLIECVETEASGDYTIEGLPSGEYAVEVEQTASYPRTYFTGKFEARDANLVTVSAPSTKNGVDFALAAGAKVTGRVTSAVTKVGIRSATVCIRDEESERLGDCEQTNSNGEYKVENLAPGRYFVYFDGPSESEYVDQIYNGKTVFEEGETIVLGTESVISNLNATLALGGTVTGRVTASGGAPIGEVDVCALTLTDEETISCGGSDANGNYSIVGLPTGEYKIAFGGSRFSAPNVAPQFFSARNSYAEADPVSVTSSHVTTNIDAVLGVGGEISGTVTDGATGRAVHDFAICAYEERGFSAGCAATDAAGNYTIWGLASGDYRVRFLPPFNGESVLAAQFYNAAGTLAGSAPVGVLAGSGVSEVDAVLEHTELPVAGEPPFIVGEAEVGRTLGDGPAEWDNAVRSITYQWSRCDARGNACEPIPGADGRNYTVSTSDAGHTLRLSETASNIRGSAAPIDSPLTRVIPGAVASTPPAETPPAGATTGAGGAPSTKSTPLSSEQIVRALLASLAPAGKGAHIATLRKRGSYALVFSAPAAGTLSISWYLLPKGARLSRAKPVLVASGRAVATSTGKLPVTVRLNPKGRALIKHTHRLKLTARGSFKANAGGSATAIKAFVLH